MLRVEMGWHLLEGNFLSRKFYQELIGHKGTKTQTSMLRSNVRPGVLGPKYKL